jgi:membrane-bound inhibitor of C-type lysozyme
MTAIIRPESSRPMRFPRPVPCLALALLFGCAGGGEPPRYPADATVYKCDDDKQLVVQYLGGGKSAMVMYPERDFRLDQVSTASGASYSNGRTTLHTKGAEAFLEEGGQTLFANCTSAAK